MSLKINFKTHSLVIARTRRAAQQSALDQGLKSSGPKPRSNSNTLGQSAERFSSQLKLSEDAPRSTRYLGSHRGPSRDGRPTEKINCIALAWVMQICKRWSHAAVGSSILDEKGRGTYGLEDYYECRCDQRTTTVIDTGDASIAFVGGAIIWKSHRECRR